MWTVDIRVLLISGGCLVMAFLVGYLLRRRFEASMKEILGSCAAGYFATYLVVVLVEPVLRAGPAIVPPFDSLTDLLATFLMVVPQAFSSALLVVAGAAFVRESASLTPTPAPEPPSPRASPAPA